MKEQCEAINSFGSKAGEQCTEEACATKDGRHVCWTHARALENLRRPKPVEFVAVIPWQQSA